MQGLCAPRLSGGAEGSWGTVALPESGDVGAVGPVVRRLRALQAASARMSDWIARMGLVGLGLLLLVAGVGRALLEAEAQPGGLATWGGRNDSSGIA